MKYNKWIKKINRLFLPRPTKEENKRLDMAERIVGFPDNLFQDFLSTVTQEDFIAYPSYSEYESLKEDIAKHVDLKPKNIFLSTGSGACIKSLCELTLGRGHNVVSPIPSYPMYGIYGRLYGAEHIGVKYNESNIFDLGDLVNRINNKTRLVVISNPFSPIGDYKSIDELRELCEICKDRKIVLLIDEAYVEFSPGTVLPLIQEYDNVVISRTFSKAFGAAGIRVGYLLGSSKIIKLITKTQLTYPLSGVSVKFASFLLDNIDEIKDYTKKTIKDRNLLCDLLEASGYDVVRSHTNSIHFHETTSDNSHTINKLKEAGLAFKSGSEETGTPVRVPGDERGTWIRMSTGPNIHNIIKGALL